MNSWWKMKVLVQDSETSTSQLPWDLSPGDGICWGSRGWLLRVAEAVGTEVTGSVMAGTTQVHRIKEGAAFRHKTRLPYAHIWGCVCVCVLQSAKETIFYKGSTLLICLEWQELQKQLRIRFPFTKPQMDFNLKAQCRKQITIVLLGKRNTARQALPLNQSSQMSKWLVFLMLSTFWK